MSTQLPDYVHYVRRTYTYAYS